MQKKNRTLAEIANMLNENTESFFGKSFQTVEELVKYLGFNKKLKSNIALLTELVENGEKRIVGHLGCCDKKIDINVSELTEEQYNDIEYNSNGKCPFCNHLFNSINKPNYYSYIDLFSDEDECYESGFNIKVVDDMMFFWTYSFEAISELNENDNYKVNFKSIEETKKTYQNTRTKSYRITDSSYYSAYSSSIFGFWTEKTGVRFLKAVNEPDYWQVGSLNHDDYASQLIMILTNPKRSKTYRTREYSKRTIEKQIMLTGDLEKAFALVGTDDMDDFAEKITTIKRKARAPKKKAINPSERFLNISIKVPEIKSSSTFAFVVDAFGETTNYEYKCPKCGHINHMQRNDGTRHRYWGREENDQECEHCKESIEVSLPNNSISNTYEDNNDESKTLKSSYWYLSLVDDPSYHDAECIYEDWQKKPCLCFDKIDVHSTVSKVENEIEQVDRFELTYRVIMANDKIHFFEKNDKSEPELHLPKIGYGFKIKNLNDYRSIIGGYGSFYYGCSQAKNIQQPEEILDIIKKSCLGAKGLYEWAEFTNMRYGALNIRNILSPDSYAYRLYKFPAIEKLAKSGFASIAENYDGEDGTLEEILGADNKKIVKIAREVNKENLELPHGMINLLNSVYKYDKTITAKDAMELYSSYTLGYLLVPLRLGVKIKRIQDYLDACYMHQCIRKSEALQIWSDYLNMAKDIGYDLTDKSVKFPSSLKKEHDRALFVFDTLKHDIDKKKFEHRSEELKKYRYTSEEEDGFFITTPECPEDVINEGRQQSHCVASYVNSIKDGNACVVFLRRKICPDKSYFTIEIDEDKMTIVQAKGFANRLPDETTKEMIKEYAKEKKLTISRF